MITWPRTPEKGQERRIERTVRVFLLQGTNGLPIVPYRLKEKGEREDMNGVRQLILILLLGLSSICTSSVLAAEVPWASLRGLKGVGVVVEELTPDAKRAGLVEEQLRLDVEWRLRKAGITVLSGANLRGVSGAPYLSISVAALQGKGRLAPLFVYATKVELKQGAILVRDDSLNVSAATWTLSGVSMSGLRRFRQGAHTRVASYVDRFIRDYLAVNRK